MDYRELVRDNVKHVRARMAAAALRAGRDPAEIELVAVSKTFPASAILAALDCGLHDFGENRPEEGSPKIAEVIAENTQAKPVWHMIGHIQRRKARLVAADFDMVHSLDRLILAERLSRLCVESGRVIPVLLECNISGEAAKFGYPLWGWEHDATVLMAFFKEVEALLALPGLQVVGLMTVAPLAGDAGAESVRPVFSGLRMLREVLRTRYPDTMWQHLSMGMSDDFEIAIEEGATLVRIGRAIFGTRA